jgi:hypothetical protein
MSQKKYTLEKKCPDTGLYYIKALLDIPNANVKAGDLGGRIASDESLSHEGMCWVSGDARVYGDARVSIPAELISVIMHPYNITITPQNIVVGCHMKRRDGSDGKWSDLPEATTDIKARYLPLLKQLKTLVKRKG